MTHKKLIKLSDSLGCKNTIFAWQAQYYPTGSLKDGMTPYAIKQALKNKELLPGVPIVEASSGNTGCSLAKLGKELGHPVHIFVADTVSSEKLNRIRNFGAIVHIEASAQGPQAEIIKAAEFASQHGFYLFNQFENPYHVEGYEKTVVPDLLQTLKDQDVHIDTFIGGIGSGASVIAITSGLRREHNPKMKLISVIPETFPTDIEGLHPSHESPVGEFSIWANREKGFENEAVTVLDKDAFRQTIDLHNSGFIVGPASGAVVHIARMQPEDRNILVIFSDHGDKYLEKINSWKRDS